MTSLKWSEFGTAKCVGCNLHSRRMKLPCHFLLQDDIPQLWDSSLPSMSLQELPFLVLKRSAGRFVFQVPIT